ncbi:uncharacterized protein CIMG_11087 [Coccidioides immitis RS]|uniref:Uncharacterized protein n=1 Tax=Coccidioides immitis (strain RS) TaxID=246410 RepID=A0A0D8JVX7_COCIM|nr:uncharacterized protein CIMG_11087 [Coccidioides immitis RS]KJF61480.1 hypothetical protein CIMG_11087 [Coccidioides immitis RS]
MEVNPPCSGIRRPNRSSNHDGSQVERHGWGMFASAYPLTVRGGPTGSANRMRQGKARVLFAQLVEEFQIAAVVNLAQNIRWPLTNGKWSIIWRKPPATEELRRF